MKVVAIAALILAMTDCASIKAADAVSGSGATLLNAITNHGLVTEHYRTTDGEAVLQYEQGTNDMPLSSSLSTNAGQVYECILWASQVQNAPQWDPDKTPPPLSPNKARSIAVERAFVELGSSPTYRFRLDFEPTHHWIPLEVSLLRSPLSQNMWYYRIGVKRLIPGSGLGIPDAEIFVTMDGKTARYIQKWTRKQSEK